MADLNHTIDEWLETTQTLTRALLDSGLVVNASDRPSPEVLARSQCLAAGMLVVAQTAVMLKALRDGESVLACARELARLG